MSRFKLIFVLLFVVAIGSGCASADKRLGQGIEMEQKGQYENAVVRYVQALEKDPNMDQARMRLRDVGALAIAENFAEAEAWLTRGDPVRAADHFRRADGVAARANSVGVRLERPDGYDPTRSDVFDEAFTALVASGVTAREQGRWENGLAAFQRARNEFEPSREQRNETLAEESALLVQWSDYEYGRGNLRRAFAIAERVQALEWSPLDKSAHAAENMELCLAEGEVELIVLPVQVKDHDVRRARGRRHQLAAQLEATLQDGPWRQPPAFVYLHNPLTAADLIAHGGLLDGEYRPGALALILRLADADYAAYLQIIDMEATEFDVRSKNQTAPDRAGQRQTFVREDGQRRFHAEARVVIADPLGNQIADVVVTGSGSAPFSRGVYDGDPDELNLARNQVDLFDRFVLEAQEQTAMDALVMELAQQIAGAVYQPTLAQVP
jgi:tetratricopeptide (TPR) repeat protein